jgi:hypothetical protein
MAQGVKSKRARRRRKQELQNKLRRRNTERGMCADHGDRVAIVGKSCMDCWFANISKSATGTRKNSKIIEELWIEQQGHCTKTDELLHPGENASLDHIIPVSRWLEFYDTMAGVHDKSNLQWTTKFYNTIKNNMLESELIAYCKLIISKGNKGDFMSKNGSKKRKQKNYKPEKAKLLLDNPDIMTGLKRIVTILDHLIDTTNMSWPELGRKTGRGTNNSFKTIRSVDGSSFESLCDHIGCTPRYEEVLLAFKVFDLIPYKVQRLCDELDDAELSGFIEQHDDALIDAINNYSGKEEFVKEKEDRISKLDLEIARLDKLYSEATTEEEKMELTKKLANRRESRYRIVQGI